MNLFASRGAERPLIGNEILSGKIADIVRLQTFVTHPDYCEPVLRVQGEIFGDIRPAAAIYVVSALLRPEMKVEIEATARIRRA